MKLRNITVGIIISLSASIILFMIQKLVNESGSTGESKDFQFHDSYFVVLEVGWMGYLGIFLYGKIKR